MSSLLARLAPTFVRWILALSCGLAAMHSVAQGTAFPDFDGNGDPDIFWHHTGTGNLSVWLMNGTTVAIDAPITVMPSPWKMVGFADFNGDGHKDLVWRNANDGNCIALLLANGSYLGYSALFALPPEWVVEGVADFNADGKPDFLMRNRTTGVAFAWYFSNGAPTGLDALFSLDSAWKVQAVADFSGDGQPDLLLRDINTGLALVWNTQFSAGVTSLAGSPTALFSLDPVWGVVQAADWNGDGSADLLVRNASTGVVFVWYLNGLVAGSLTGIAQRDTAFEIVPRTPLFPGAFAFELASSNATPNVANHVVRIVRSGGSEGTYDVAYTMTPTGLTGASVTPPSPIRFAPGETTKDLVLATGTTSGTAAFSLAGATAVSPTFAATTATGTHTVSVSAPGSCPDPGPNTTLVATPPPNTGTPTYGRKAGDIVIIPMPVGAPNTVRLRVFNTSQTESSLTTTFALAKCPGEVQDAWPTYGLAPCKKQGGYTGNSMGLLAAAPTPIGGVTFWNGNCGWLTADRASQWYFNIRVDNCNSGNCQFNYQIDGNGTSY